MDAFLATLGWGFLTLLVVAILVALWEHGSATLRRPPDFESPTVQPRSVDINLDQGASDRDKRSTALDSALERMSTSAAAAATWPETSPMVAPGAVAEEQRS